MNSTGNPGKTLSDVGENKIKFKLQTFCILNGMNGKRSNDWEIFFPVFGLASTLPLLPYSFEHDKLRHHICAHIPKVLSILFDFTMTCMQINLVAARRHSVSQQRAHFDFFKPRCNDFYERQKLSIIILIHSHSQSQCNDLIQSWTWKCLYSPIF